MLTQAQMLGLDDGHLVAVDDRQLEAQTAEAWQALVADARSAGFTLGLCSGWRSFERQLAIFNGKALGTRPLNNRMGDPCDVRIMSDADILDAILTWSALPGTSRHHWGTDLDWYDAGVLSPADLKLEPWEYEAGGPCHELGRWLQPRLASYGFFLPYRQALGGVSPEPWHLSFAPVSVPALGQFDANALAEQLDGADLALKETVLAQLPGLIERYCHRISLP
ncbi:M15 family metallopeptidase [Ferrimonas balearica]|uniref:M15 family metallopeptidase n=1 Tax=Ferrimonas balearica TaxID=44012 RepID=UPI001C992EDA|nr:M15 family metallopeptidase [Ferrimonas balearica]MBY5922290.1 M15 family metallopeptidase [Ferrimonas balearica]MBY5994370.1 M15 family metallopeptidase [Ferrimonas balearica]